VVNRDQLSSSSPKPMAGPLWPAGKTKNRPNSLTAESVRPFRSASSGLESKSVVFVFEQTEDEKGKRGQYLGEFTVAQVT